MVFLLKSVSVHIGIVTLVNLRFLLVACSRCRVAASGWALAIAWKSTVPRDDHVQLHSISLHARKSICHWVGPVTCLMSLVNCDMMAFSTACPHPIGILIQINVAGVFAGSTVQKTIFISLSPPPSGIPFKRFLVVILVKYIVTVATSE